MFAIKKILKSRSTTSQMHKMNHPIKIRSEINILRNLSHVSIVFLQPSLKSAVCLDGSEFELYLSCQAFSHQKAMITGQKVAFNSLSSK